MMPSKMVMDREQATSALWATGETYADEVATAYGRRFAPVVMPGEALPDVAFMQRLSVRLVVHRCRALTAADRAHDQRQHAVARLRAQRTEATVALRHVLVLARQRFEGMPYQRQGQRGLSLLGFAGRTPEQPNVLAHQAAQTIARLQELAAQPALLPPIALGANPAAWADEIEPRRAALARCLADLDQARAEALVTLAAKRRAMQAFDDAYGPAVRELACFYRLVGLPARAETLPPARLRPAPRRRPATAGNAASPTDRPPTVLPGPEASQGELRAQNGAPSPSEDELRLQNGGPSASEDELRLQNGAPSTSEGELRL